MNLVSMDIPDDPTLLPGWLERQLVGPDLGALVAELSAVHGPAGPCAPLADLLGGHRDSLLTGGLGALPPEALPQLLRHPHRLLELQELVLAEGGPYWDRLAGGAAELEEMAGRGEQRLAAFLAGPGAQPAEPAPVLRPIRPKLAWYRRPWLVSLATAAAVLLVVYGVPRLRPPVPPPPSSTPEKESIAVAPRPPPASTGWGWERPDALPRDGTAGAYLTRLADEAKEWFDRRPDDRAALAKRIGELRQGCSTLILAEHKPLAPEDRRWLVRRCRGWATQLDQEREALEAGKPVEEVRAEADATVQQISEVLRTRAESV